MKLIIKNGTIINPVHHQHEKGDVVIEDGKIVSLGGIADVPGAEVYMMRKVFCNARPD